jgi:serine/threonine-protein kinase
MAASGPSSTPLGKAFGKYVVHRQIAEGGMAVVFEARHSKLGHRVALKLLSRELRDKPDLVARFEREARAAARLESPHVCRVLDIDVSDDGRPYIVMEYLEGRDLEQLIRYRAPIPWPESVVYIIEACAAVSVAHRAGIIHRDLKPANLFLADEGQRKIIKILDFGISKVSEATDVSSTSTQTMLGTPLYMSPEQVRSARDVDGRADIWSLGVIIYELISGQPPFLRENASGVIAAIVTDPFVPIRQLRPEVPPGLGDAIARALEKNPDARYQRVEDFANALIPHAPQWFKPPNLPTTPGPGRGPLPAALTSSLADGMESDRTIADPNAMPDALPAQPIQPPTQPMFAPMSAHQAPAAMMPMPPNPLAPAGPSSITRTTAGGEKKTSRGMMFVAVIAVGAFVASLIFVAIMFVTQKR